MTNLYVNQANAQLRVDTKIDLTDATDLKVLFVKPNKKTRGYWNAVAAINPKTYRLTDLVVTFQNDDLSTAGTWKVQACIKKAGKLGLGEIKEIEVLNSIYDNGNSI